jgi:phosphatidylinositol alpha-1,6-mannosyltransferase
VAEAVISLLRDRARAAAMGEKGRSWVEREWRWEIQAERLGALLTGGGIGATGPTGHPGRSDSGSRGGHTG